MLRYTRKSSLKSRYSDDCNTMHFFPLVSLANFIIDTYFNQTRCIFIFISYKSQFEYFGTIPSIVFDLTDIEIDPGLVFNNFGCQGFIVSVKKPRSTFENIEENIRTTMERFNFRKYLFIPVDDAEEDMLEIFQSAALEYVADVDAIIKNNNTENGGLIYDIITHKYYGTEGHRDIIFLDKWYSNTQNFQFGSNLYPNKLENQYGRCLRLGTIYYVPYSIIDSLDGLDISIIMELAKKLNMTIKLVLDQTAQWGEIYPNFTGNGILGNLVMDRTDIGFASMFVWEEKYHYLDVSKQTIKSSISCLVPGPKLIGDWKTPFFAFDVPIWTVFAITIILSVATLYSALTWNSKHIGLEKVKFFKHFIKSVLLTEAMYLNQSVTNIPKNFSTRLVFSMILTMSLVLGAIYDSGLASSMTIPRYSGVIRNPQDMIANNIHWGATEDAWILSIQRSESATHKNIVKLFVIEPEEKLAERNEDRKFAFAIERLQGGNFAVGSYITEDGAKIRRILDEDLYFDYMAFYMKKSSILLPYLDDVILRVAQAGLLEVWEYDAISRYSDTRIQKIIKNSIHVQKPGPSRLKFSHVEGAFVILIIGLAISFICFITEFLFYYL